MALLVVMTTTRLASLLMAPSKTTRADMVATLATLALATLTAQAVAMNSLQPRATELVATKRRPAMAAPKQLLVDTLHPAQLTLATLTLPPVAMDHQAMAAVLRLHPVDMGPRDTLVTLILLRVATDLQATLAKLRRVVLDPLAQAMASMVLRLRATAAARSQAQAPITRPLATAKPARTACLAAGTTMGRTLATETAVRTCPVRSAARIATTTIAGETMDAVEALAMATPVMETAAAARVDTVEDMEDPAATAEEVATDRVTRHVLLRTTN